MKGDNIMKKKTAVATMVVLLVSGVTVNATPRLEVSVTRSPTEDEMLLAETEKQASDDKQKDEVYVLVGGESEKLLIAECKKADSDYWEYLFEKDKYDAIAEEVQQNCANLSYDMAVDDGLEVYVKFKSKEATNTTNVISDIRNGSNALRGNWLVMVLNGLKLDESEQILDLIKQDGIEHSYQICSIASVDGSLTVSIEATTYQIVEGDTLSEIAEKKWTTVEELVELNPQIADPNLIYCGDFIKLK